MDSRFSGIHEGLSGGYPAPSSRLVGIRAGLKGGAYAAPHPLYYVQGQGRLFRAQSKKSADWGFTSDQSRDAASELMWEQLRVQVSHAMSDTGSRRLGEVASQKHDESGRKIALVLEYDGTEYEGFQVQPGKRTVQGTLEQALEKLYGEPVKTQGASRTDAGAHAEAQVAAFCAPRRRAPSVIRDALNFHLPRDVKVREARLVAEDFDARRDATGRVYTYLIWNAVYPSPLLGSTSHHVRGLLEADVMDRAARLLEGQHDFTSFTTDEYAAAHSCVRNVREAQVARSGDLVTLTMEANAFMPHQVRRTAGALVEVGLGRVTIAQFSELVDRPGLRKAGPTAPAKGLTLKRVLYADFPPARRQEGREAFANDLVATRRIGV